MTTNSKREIAPGTRLGPYEVVSLIGASGMGEVYKAFDKRLNRAVASTKRWIYFEAANNAPLSTN